MARWRPARIPIRRNTALLALCLVLLSGVLQLAVAVATITLVLVTGIESILGLGPAIFLTAGALAALPAGRLMDRLGRVPVIAGGFVVGMVGCLLTALGCIVDSASLVILGFVGVGAMNGAVLLARTAAADMYPAGEESPRDLVRPLRCAVRRGARAARVPAALRREGSRARHARHPLVRGGGDVCRRSRDRALDPARPAHDRPRARSAPALAAGEPHTTEPAAPLGQILRRPGVPSAVLAALASFAVMAGVMNLTGYIVVGHEHEQADVFSVISLHIVGMFGLVLVVGQLIDRVGRHRSLIGGLAIMAVSTVMLAWVVSIPAMSLSLFLLGLGWNVSYVAASTELVTHATPVERGRLVGFTDLVAGLLAAALALVGGLAYTEWGVAAIAVGATIAVVAPALALLLARRPPAAAPEPAAEP